MQRVASFFGERQADEAAAKFRHEVDGLGRHFFRSHGEVALVLAIFVVHENDHPPLADLLNRFFDRSVSDVFSAHLDAPEKCNMR